MPQAFQSGGQPQVMGIVQTFFPVLQPYDFPYLTHSGGGHFFSSFLTLLLMPLADLECPAWAVPFRSRIRHNTCHNNTCHSPSACRV
jgi:hypothetical protein